MYSSPNVTNTKSGSAPPRPLREVGSSNVSGAHPPSPNPVGALAMTRSVITGEETESINKDSNGVVFTWENLSVWASNGKGKRVQILDGLSGYARPSEVLAIMGPSGCGKSSLLDALAGRLAPNLTQTGVILVNGRRQDLAFGTSAYVTQDDVLMTTLTVREAIYYAAQLQLPNSMPQHEKKARAEETIREMGLSGAKDTRIGGRHTKGISGGQRRRVSICMEILTHPELLFLDEPTSGLDSAASYHVMSRIAGLARQEGMTIVAAIHQPSSGVFELFQSLCLLAYGKTVYFGPASDTTTFFASNGSPCPALRNPSDHFLRIINKDFDKEVVNQEEEDIEEPAMSATKAIRILVSAYESSDYSHKVAQNIADIHLMESQVVRNHRRPSFISQSLVLTQRSFLNMHRDFGYYWFRIGIYMAVGLCVGLIYHDFGYNYQSIQGRRLMLVFVSGFLTFMAIGGFPSFVEDMKIFRRERLNGHYDVSIFVISNTVSSIPFLALTSLIPGVLAYYLAGLQPGAIHFVFFILTLFACLIIVESLMMIVASVVPDYLMGIMAGAGIQGIMLLNSGFFQPANRLPKFLFRYPLHYIAFQSYANQAFLKNEFLGLNLPSGINEGSPKITGYRILSDVWDIDMAHSKWVDLGVLFAIFVIFRVLFLVIVSTSEKVKPVMKKGLCNKADT